MGNLISSFLTEHNNIPVAEKEDLTLGMKREKAPNPETELEKIKDSSSAMEISWTSSAIFR